MNIKQGLLVLLMLTFLVISPRALSSKSYASQFVENESSAYRRNLAEVVAFMIPDDVVRKEFTDRMYIIDVYSTDPSNWKNPKDHIYHENLLDAVEWSYKMLVYYLRRSDWENAVKFYGILAHYIGDCSDPFNTNNITEEIYNDSLVYEIFLELESDTIFQNILQAQMTLDRAINVYDIKETAKTLCEFSKSSLNSVLNAIKENDTARLVYEISKLSRKATEILYAILIKSFNDGNVSEIDRLLQRWWTIPLITSFIAIIILYVWEIRRRKKIEEPKIEFGADSL